MNTKGDREMVSSTGRSRCLVVKDHMRRQVAGSRGRQKVIHKGSKKAKVQAGNRQKAPLVRQAKLSHTGGLNYVKKQHSEYNCVTKQTISHNDGGAKN